MQRSTVLIDPLLPETAMLREWWETSGRGAATSHVGEGLATALKCVRWQGVCGVCEARGSCFPRKQGALLHAG